jgi:hypothetical protein
MITDVRSSFIKGTLKEAKTSDDLFINQFLLRLVEGDMQNSVMHLQGVDKSSHTHNLHVLFGLASLVESEMIGEPERERLFKIRQKSASLARKLLIYIWWYFSFSVSDKQTDAIAASIFETWMQLICKAEQERLSFVFGILMLQQQQWICSLRPLDASSSSLFNRISIRL